MKQIQIIAFNVPYPADYGGVIDVFYKIKALKEARIAVILHCFDYGRGTSPELEALCEHVYYYPRSKSFIYQFSKLPFIVKTRSNRLLIDNLNQYTDIPILAEGLHCTFPLFADQCRNNDFYVRTHNIEHAYYEGLKATETNIVKKNYFSLEAKKLKSYEQVLKKAKGILAISQRDNDYFSALNTNTQLVTPFHPFQKVEIKEGKADYVLVHGDLSVSENIHSLQWLINNVLSKIKHKVIIAGKNPSQKLILHIQKHKNIQLIANPSFEKMQDLIANAQVHVVHSFLPQGMKLKLLNVLFHGRHCICNEAVVLNSGLESLCHIANDAETIIQYIDGLMLEPFTENNMRNRKDMLSLFSNELQVEKIIKFLNL
ncbi:MAG: glycosyltransferase [Bacteroidales bacterium]|nr:glycosyltransferase [Bacteroidales bacterium]